MWQRPEGGGVDVVTGRTMAWGRGFGWKWLSPSVSVLHPQEDISISGVWSEREESRAWQHKKKKKKGLGKRQNKKAGRGVEKN